MARASFWRFSITVVSASSISLAAGHCSHATGHLSRATRRYLPRPFPAGYCLPPTAELRKIEWARSGRADPLSLFYYAPNQAIPAEKSIRCSLLAAVGPLTILSWPEALNASGSRRACRMAIRRNACSLLALPDFPEFAQAVRYGVPGTPELLEIGRSGSSRRRGAAAHCTV